MIYYQQDDENTNRYAFVLRFFCLHRAKSELTLNFPRLVKTVFKKLRKKLTKVTSYQRHVYGATSMKFLGFSDETVVKIKAFSLYGLKFSV